MATTSLSLPSRLLGRFLSQEHFSLNIAVMTTRNNNSPQETQIHHSLHTVLALIVPSLLSFLELKYQGKNISPFDTHPITMWVTIACLLSYWLTYSVEMTCFNSLLPPSPYARALPSVMLLFGSLSVGSLASILFPDSIQLTLFLIYMLLTLCQFTTSCKWMRQMIMVKLFGASQQPQDRRTSPHAQWLVQYTFNSNRNILPLDITHRLAGISKLVNCGL